MGRLTILPYSSSLESVAKRPKRPVSARQREILASGRAIRAANIARRNRERQEAVETPARAVRKTGRVRFTDNGGDNGKTKGDDGREKRSKPPAERREPVAETVEQRKEGFLSGLGQAFRG
jgi:hypothetical protein